MATDEEKRSIAQSIRESGESAWDFRKQLSDEGTDVFCDDQADYYLIHKAVTGYIPAEHMHPQDYSEFHNRLADLIEPKPERTCTIESWRYDEMGDLSDVVYITYELSCGHSDDSFCLPKYCPTCGAKVVNNEDEED